jgi:hypothetical protein
VREPLAPARRLCGEAFGKEAVEKSVGIAERREASVRETVVASQCGLKAEANPHPFTPRVRKQEASHGFDTFTNGSMARAGRRGCYQQERRFRHDLLGLDPISRLRRVRVAISSERSYGPLRGLKGGAEAPHQIGLVPRQCRRPHDRASMAGVLDQDALAIGRRAHRHTAGDGPTIGSGSGSG